MKTSISQDIDAYVKIAKGVGVFKPEEIEIIDEVVRDYYAQPQRDYFLIQEERQDQVVAYLIFGRADLTKFSWDIYWLVVEKDHQGKGIGKSLLARMVEFLLEKEKRAVIRVETSTKHEYAHARNLYARCGFQEVGRIAEFYAPQDDLIIYSKDIQR